MIAVEQARKHTAVLYGDIAEIIYGKQDKGAQHAGAPAGQKGEQICACKPQKPRMPAQGVYARVAYAAAIALYVGFAKGQGKVTYGTGSSVMLNAGKTRPRNAKGLATSLAWARHNTVSYALEGNINYAAATLNWMCDDLGLVERVENMEALAAGITDTGGVYLVPAFSGLGAPWFDNSIRAGIVGMNRTTRKAQVVRAALESIAYQVTDVVDAMTSALGTPPTRLCADGGPTHNGFLMQFQADMLRFPLYLNRMSECSAAGAALCAAEASGFCNPEQTFRTGQSVVVPKESMATRDQRYLGWLNAIHTLQDKGAPT